MARLVNDRLLAVLVRSPVARLRLWAARKSAERGLHWLALRGQVPDPYVLARLGLYPQALAASAFDAESRFGHSLAHAGLGHEVTDIFDDLAQRRLIAAALAPHEPGEAAVLLANPVERAACLIAAQQYDNAAVSISGAEGIETALIGAHLATGRGDHRAARRGWNAAFETSGLAPPIEDGDHPISLADFHSQENEVRGDGPLISVVIPFKDSAATLETAVRSILRQSWRNFELLLVNDGSNDGSAAIAAGLANGDGRVRLLANVRRPGVYGARNSGIDAARGTFLTYLDADDWSPGERLKRQIESIGGGHVAAIANHVRIDEAGRPVAPRVFPLARPVPITMFVRREILAAAGPFEERDTGADSEMLGRIEMLHGKQAVARDPAILLVASWRRGSLSEAVEGGLFGAGRYRYRAEWMVRHAGRQAELASLSMPGLDGS